MRGRIMAGVLLIIPLAITAVLIRYVYEAALAMGAKAGNWLNWAIQWLLAYQAGEPKPASPDAIEPFIDPANPDWFGVTVAISLTILMFYLLGGLGTNVVGRRLIGFFEGLVERIPLVATVYSAIKQMVQALSGQGKVDDSMQQVVLIDFPHENMKAIAFMTNLITDTSQGEKLATVYIPTTPNPTSGYMLIVPLDRITQTDWTMEDALSMVLSGGATARSEVMLTPPGKTIWTTKSPKGTTKPAKKKLPA